MACFILPLKFSHTSANTHTTCFLSSGCALSNYSHTLTHTLTHTHTHTLSLSLSLCVSFFLYFSPLFWFFFGLSECDQALYPLLISSSSSYIIQTHKYTHTHFVGKKSRFLSSGCALSHCSRSSSVGKYSAGGLYDSS